MNPPGEPIRNTAAPLLVLAIFLAIVPAVSAQSTDTIFLRGRKQTLHLYGDRGKPPVIITSGDGGWLHLGPQVAATLAARGYFVVGFDAKAYLASFTSGSTTLRPEDEPPDFLSLITYAGRGSAQKPILIGVSEGAGLSLLAATEPSVKAAITGVIALGLPDINELGWRWKDSIIYLTHGNPDEPTFSTRAIADRVAPTPLAAIHATQDEFVPLSEVQAVMDRAREPKKLWIVKAGNHRFSDNIPEFTQRLEEAIAWVRSNAIP
jgi:fermentation-respiration switch protein FrsA (DUF1100 family)